MHRKQLNKWCGLTRTILHSVVRCTGFSVNLYFPFICYVNIDFVAKCLLMNIEFLGKQCCQIQQFFSTTRILQTTLFYDNATKKFIVNKAETVLPSWLGLTKISLQAFLRKKIEETVLPDLTILHSVARFTGFSVNLLYFPFYLLRKHTFCSKVPTYRCRIFCKQCCQM